MWIAEKKIKKMEEKERPKLGDLAYEKSKNKFNNDF